MKTTMMIFLLISFFSCSGGIQTEKGSGSEKNPSEEGYQYGGQISFFDAFLSHLGVSPVYAKEIVSVDGVSKSFFSKFSKDDINSLYLQIIAQIKKVHINAKNPTVLDLGETLSREENGFVVIILVDQGNVPVLYKIVKVDSEGKFKFNLDYAGEYDYMKIQGAYQNNKGTLIHRTAYYFEDGQEDRSNIKLDYLRDIVALKAITPLISTGKKSKSKDLILEEENEMSELLKIHSNEQEARLVSSDITFASHFLEASLNFYKSDIVKVANQIQYSFTPDDWLIFSHLTEDIKASGYKSREQLTKAIVDKKFSSFYYEEASKIFSKAADLIKNRKSDLYEVVTVLDGEVSEEETSKEEKPKEEKPKEEKPKEEKPKEEKPKEEKPKEEKPKKFIKE